MTLQWLEERKILLIALLGVFACNDLDRDVESTEEASESAQQARGEELFLRHCASCHGVFGRGQSLPTPGEPVVSRDLSSPEFQEQHTDEQIRVILERGVAPGMPSFASVLSDEQKHAVIAHVRTLGTAR